MTHLYKLILLFLSLASPAQADAQEAWLYIQGDKSVPFYVKIDSIMQPRYGKNYCIATNLKSGKVNVDILFQQNIYPPKSFSVDMPATGYKGYLLAKEGENFTLTDIETKAILNSREK